MITLYILYCQIFIFTLTMDQMIMCKVIGISHHDEPKDNYLLID